MASPNPKQEHKPLSNAEEKCVPHRSSPDLPPGPVGENHEPSLSEDSWPTLCTFCGGRLGDNIFGSRCTRVLQFERRRLAARNIRIDFPLEQLHANNQPGKFLVPHQDEFGVRRMYCRPCLDYAYARVTHVKEMGWGLESTWGDKARTAGTDTGWGGAGWGWDIWNAEDVVPGSEEKLGWEAKGGWGAEVTVETSPYESAWA
ncbi:hypothetical protein FPV67DRAFT_1671143 [Lyophyllum atratum]|nr:hypothetical protein FPV67DRAFT_1671143 [Lyophyllum atratum]